MMTKKLKLHALKIEGFRAYLSPKEFNFEKKSSLAIFAPNAKGKSSIVDSLEFFLSDGGSLDKLGLRAVNNKAGPQALAHVKAEQLGITPRVEITILEDGNQKIAGRNAVAPIDPKPELASDLSTNFRVDPIIRGHELRSFVENRSEEQRYQSIATWLGLGPLVEAQRNTRNAKLRLASRVRELSGQNPGNLILRRASEGNLLEYAEAEVLQFANEKVLGGLKKPITLKSVSEADPGYVEIKMHAEEESEANGLASLEKLLQAVQAVYRVESETEVKDAKGDLAELQNLARRLNQAIEAESKAKADASNAAFEGIWQQVQKHFDGEDPDWEECPVCETPIEDTKAGSIEGIKTHVRLSLKDVKEYADAKEAVRQIQALFDRKIEVVATRLENLIALLDESHSELVRKIEAFVEHIKEGTLDDSEAKNLSIDLLNLQIELEAAIVAIKNDQGDVSFNQALLTLDKLIDSKKEHELHQLRISESMKLREEFDKAEKLISGNIRRQIEFLLHKIQDPMREIYNAIQGDASVQVNLQLPPEDDSNQQRLRLTIDFSDNRQGVQPSGYLSDSQIHTLALALQIAAITQFNKCAPLVVLDDIVTSYDADHRRRIGGMLADKLSEYQVLVLTHDERFFIYLKEQCPTENWQFQRIVSLDPDTGPIFMNDLITDEVIKARWDKGESAANEIRRAEEEWLLKMCREFRTMVEIRPIDRPYNYNRGELAQSLAKFLNSGGRNLKPKAVEGVAGSMLNSLARGEIENFGSHFQDGPYGSGSIGDEKARWQEFVDLREQFQCQKCGGTVFKRPPGMTSSVCTKESCETKFEFADG